MEKNPILFFGINLSKWSKPFLMAFCVIGLFSSLLIKAVIHEYLLKHYHFKEPIFLTLCLFITDVISTFPTPYLILKKEKELKAPLVYYIGISTILAIAKVLMNFASLRITYTTGVLFKSCNLIPVMLGNIIFLKKKPKLVEIFAVLLYVIGLTVISLGDKQVHNEFDLSGLIAISIAMILKAIACNLEEMMMSTYGASQDELIAILYSFSTIAMFFFSITTGQLFSGIKRIENNMSILFLVLIVVVLGAISVQFVFLTIKSFGSLINDMLLSCRKVLTVCLSFFVFKDKKFTSLHAIALCFICVGMSINIHEKTKGKKKKMNLPKHDSKHSEDQTPFLTHDNNLNQNIILI